MELNSMMKTEFCSKEVDNVTCDKDKEYIFNKMKMLSDLKFNDKYAKLFNTKYSNNLNNPHIFCIKSSGNPYLLFLININNTNYTFLIDKKVKRDYKYPGIYLMNNCFSDDLYSGTLFETELIREYNSTWSLLIGDIYTYRGKKVNDIIMDRVNKITNILENNYDDNKNDLCKIEVKRYFDYKDIDYVANVFVKKLRYNTRGIYFVPLKISYSKMLYLFNNKELNENKENKEEFLMIKTNKPEIYELYKKDNGNNIQTGYAYIRNIEMSKKVNSLFDKETYQINIHCKYNKIFQRWEPII